MEQAHIYFKGMVQGVGFRFMCQMHARDTGLKGWVRNLSDDSVEMVVEGSRESIEELVNQLKNHFGSYIKDTAINYKPAQNQYTSFDIRH